MKRHELWIASCTVLWLSACSMLPRPVVPDHQNAARREAEVRTRWVGVTKLWTKGCPAADAPGWSVRPLFPLEGLNPKLKRSARNAKLHRFCVYEYKGKLPDRQLARLELPRSISARLRSVEPDRVALSGMANLKVATSGSFYQSFRKQVEIPPDLPPSTSKVRLVFLDTQPTGEGIPEPAESGLSPHGYTLMHIAGHIAGPLICENGNDPCAVKVASRLALPLVKFQPWEGAQEESMSTGGYRGTFVHLFQALSAEIAAWQPTPAQPHMVINLSAGWDGEKLELGGWEANLDPMSLVGAIHGLLQTAATQGILVIAAAGNERGGPTPTGQPLLPGGWEKPYRLSSPGMWGWTSPAQPPLVYAVSGVDGQGHPLVNTREKGEAPRVAYADHVVVPDFHLPEANPAVYTATLTGTSAATAVVSTIAAIVWSYRPNLTPAQVMDLLSNSGQVLPRKHDFADPDPQAPPVPEVSRITLCSAVTEALQSEPSGCEAMGLGIAQDPFTSFTPADSMGSTGTAFFPGTAYTDLRDDPWVGPQPAMDPCPSCGVDPDGGAALFLPSPAEIAVVADASLGSIQEPTFSLGSSRLLIEIPNNWAAGELKQATLEIFGFHQTTGRKMRIAGYSIPAASSLVGGDTAEVTFAQPSQPFQAYLSFVLAPPAGAPPNTTRSVITPLFVNSSGN